MKRIVLLLLVPLLSASCGLSPAAPSPTPVESATGRLGLSLQLFSAPDSPEGLGSPTRVTFRVGESSGVGGTVESATITIVSASGVTLVEQLLAPGTPILPGAMGEFQTVLTWSTELGAGRRLDASVTVRDALGRTLTSSLSVAVK